MAWYQGAPIASLTPLPNPKGSVRLLLDTVLAMKFQQVKHFLCAEHSAQIPGAGVVVSSCASLPLSLL